MSASPATIDPKGPLPAGVVLPEIRFAETPVKESVEAIAFRPKDGMLDFYPGPMIGAGALGKKYVEGGSLYVRRALALYRALTPDAYTEYLELYYEAGLARYGENWGYADIVTVLLGLAEDLAPKRYLEIGVRRGRSACAVGSVARNCSMVFFDMWMKNYAGMDNPGPDLVKAELARVGHQGTTEFVNGNSHETVPAYFAAHPDAEFDIITVDGDHSNLGAAQDIADVLPHLKIGGAIVFDDICHPKHPGLTDVWDRMVGSNRRFSVYNYDSVGYGIGFAVRKY